jgi:hypothetical protein
MDRYENASGLDSSPEMDGRPQSQLMGIGTERIKKNPKLQKVI